MRRRWVTQTRPSRSRKRRKTRGGAGLSPQPQCLGFSPPKEGSETRGRSGRRGSRGACRSRCFFWEGSERHGLDVSKAEDAVLSGGRAPRGQFGSMPRTEGGRGRRQPRAGGASGDGEAEGSGQSERDGFRGSAAAWARLGGNPHVLLTPDTEPDARSALNPGPQANDRRAA